MEWQASGRWNCIPVTETELCSAYSLFFPLFLSLSAFPIFSFLFFFFYSSSARDQEDSTGKSIFKLLRAAPSNTRIIFKKNCQETIFHFSVALNRNTFSTNAEGVLNIKRLHDLFYWATFLKIQETSHTLQQCKCDWNNMLKFRLPQKENK